METAQKSQCGHQQTNERKVQTNERETDEITEAHNNTNMHFVFFFHRFVGLLLFFSSHHLWLPHAEAHRPITSSSSTTATAKPTTTTATLTRNECFEHVFSFIVCFFWGSWLWALFDLHVALITILDVAEKSSFKWRRTHKEYTIKWSNSGRPQEIVRTVSNANANEIKYKNIVSLFVCVSIECTLFTYVSLVCGDGGGGERDKRKRD